MANTKIPIEQCISPTGAVSNALAYIADVNSQGKYVLGSTEIVVDASGYVNTEVTFANLVDCGISYPPNLVQSAVSTYIDLDKGTEVVLYLNGNCTIDFANPPPEGFCDSIDITVIRNVEVSTPFTITFGGTVYREKGLVTQPTAEVGAIDMLSLLLFGDGELYVRPYNPNFKLNSSSGEVYKRTEPASGPEMSARSENPSVTNSALIGKIVSGNSDGSLNATDISTDGFAKITSRADLSGCQFTRLLNNAPTVAATSSFTVSGSGDVVFRMTQDVDITKFTVSNTGPEYLCVVIVRIKDATDTPRLITFDPEIFTSTANSELTQTVSARDIIVIEYVDGVYILNVLNDYRK